MTDKFYEIKSTHRLRAYIPPQWPLPDVLNQLIRKSSGQFIYASTVIHYVSSIRHKPTDRLDIVLGIRPPQKDLPFAELDALYMHILAGVEYIEPVLDILSFVLFSRGLAQYSPSLVEIETFLSLQTGDVELYLGDLSSVVSFSDYQYIHILHASLTDFFLDPTRSKELWINPPARYAAFSRRCLQSLQLKGKKLHSSHKSQFIFPKENVDLFSFGFHNTVRHLENAEMTTELRDDLIEFSFDDLHNVFKNYKTHNPNDHLTIFRFFPRFLECLKKLVGHHSHMFSAY